MISTKYGMIDNHMVYLKEKAVELCFGYISSVFKNLDINDIHFIDVKAGDGAFYNYLEGLSRVAYDPLGAFKEANIANFLRVPFIPTDKTMKFSIGFPDVREYESYINHSIELGIDFIAFVVPISGGNKKNRLNYEKHGYTILFNEQLPVDSFRLANGEDWNQNLNFIIVSKNKYLSELYQAVEPKFTYNDIFNIYTINTTQIKIKETTHPWQFKENRKMPWSRNLGRFYAILTDDDGYKFYYQDGVNKNKIGKCDLYIPLRYFPSSNERFQFYPEFQEELFGKIGFGLKLKEGYRMKKDFEKNLYIIYNETFKGVFVQIATMDESTIRSFYEMKRLNNGLFIGSIKLIKRSKVGIKK